MSFRNIFSSTCLPRKLKKKTDVDGKSKENVCGIRVGFFFSSNIKTKSDSAQTFFRRGGESGNAARVVTTKRKFCGMTPLGAMGLVPKHLKCKKQTLYSAGQVLYEPPFSIVAVAHRNAVGLCV